MQPGIIRGRKGHVAGYAIPDSGQEATTVVLSRKSMEYELLEQEATKDEQPSDISPATARALQALTMDLRALPVANIREKLEARPSPFIKNNYFGGGFVHDDDRVALQSMLFASGSHQPRGRRMGSVPEDSSPDYQSPGSSRGHSAERWRSVDRSMSRRSSIDSNQDAFMPLPKYAYRAGPRMTIYHNPAKVHVAVVTCGSLCPGLNDVVQSIWKKCRDYGVPEDHILGIRYGFGGFYDKEHRPIVLTQQLVDNIQLEGGTFLGTSEGSPASMDVKKIVRQLDLWKIDMLFVVGGTGGNAGAHAIHRECDHCRVPCSVVSVPKSIENDILLVDRTFGFDTAVEEAQKALLAAKVEASSAYRGIGVVKLMGRESGFIAVQASLASGVVDAVLIPEVHFSLEGQHGLLAYMEDIINTKGHCVICAAEGAGQDLIRKEMQSSGVGDLDEVDEHGNPLLHDIGSWLKSKFKKHLPDTDIKLIDPSYLIRSIPTTTNDRIYCKMLGHGAAHAAFAGFSDVCIGLVNTHYVILPIPIIIQAPRKVDPQGELWNRLRSSIGQPNFH